MQGSLGRATVSGVSGAARRGLLRGLASRAATPELKLIYFPVRARAEAVRMQLAYGKVPYTEETVTSYFGVGWKGAKPQASFGQLPLLCVDGQLLAQSGSINRYVATLTGCVPSEPFAAAKCDECFEAAQDLAGINPIVNVFVGEAFDAKKTDYFDSFGGKLSNLAARLGEGPFFCGEQIAYCDFAVYHQLHCADMVKPGCLAEHANVVAFMASVEALPGVREYLAQRPDAVDIGVKPALVPKPKRE